MLYFSNFSVFVAVYFITAYLQKFKLEKIRNLKLNLWLLIISVISVIIIHFTINILGTKISLLKNTGLYMAHVVNIFHLIVGFTLFNIFNNVKFKNNIINYISSLSLLIYIIHDNILLRNYVKPIIYEKIYYKYNHNLLAIQIIILTIITFVVSAILSTLYKEIIQKMITKKISNKIKREIVIE